MDVNIKSKTVLAITSICAAATIFAGSAMAKVSVGDIAPDVQVIDSNGDQRTLGEFKGQDVVLEWTNHQCPYVKKHYKSQNMQNLQKRAEADGVVWLSVISSAPGKQGYVGPERANELTNERGAVPTAVLLDSSGETGRAYAAKTTPHMYIVDKEGVLQYQGAIDSKPNTREASIAEATNYVTAALDAMQAGTAIAQTETQAYGCSVKY